LAQSIEIAQNSIQEKEIRDFIDKVNQATNNRDVDGLVEMISPSAQIITVSEIGSSATTINIDNLKLVVVVYLLIRVKIGSVHYPISDSIHRRRHSWIDPGCCRISKRLSRFC
jgi:hypothetical protein